MKVRFVYYQVRETEVELDNKFQLLVDDPEVVANKKYWDLDDEFCTVLDKEWNYLNVGEFERIGIYNNEGAMIAEYH